jgi:glyoxylase-like metal-dependent hydrolase (beta-lactamase superfamily II)
MRNPQLELIDLDQPALTGYRRFISSWLSRGGGLDFVVDPGPASTASVLCDRLRALGVERLDYILLTHIHLDHGGATAALLQEYPTAQVACHPAARNHVIAPERLWEGSRQVLGDVADIYGEPAPVPAAALADLDALAGRGITVIETPGHAPHHLSFLHRGTLFVGEAAGTFMDLGAGSWYLRPATPPRFRLEVALTSLDRLLALTPAPRRLAFAHHGLLAGRARALLELARAQHARWVDVVRAALAAAPADPDPPLGADTPGADTPGAAAPGAAADEDALLARITSRLDTVDPHFARRRHLPADIRAREDDFTRQSLRGMVAYAQATAAGEDRQQG